MAQSKKSESGFIRAGVPLKHRMIACTQAFQKTGKSRLALTGPPPIAVINIDQGIHRAIQGRARELGMTTQTFQESIELYIADYRQQFTNLRNGNSAANVMKAAEEQLDRMRDDYIEALRDARTVMVDGGGELYETVRLACFGKTEKVMGREYGPVNREMKLWLDLGRASDANVLFTHRLRDQYVNDKKTGGSEMEGWKKMVYECDIVLQHWKDDKEPFPDRFHCTILESGMNPEVEGEDFAGPLVDFALIAQFVFPESKDSDWR
jgi:AAA domain